MTNNKNHSIIIMVIKMNKITRVMLISFIVNTILSSCKVIMGSIAKSQALIADGIHSFSDLSTDIIAIVGNKLSLKKADDKHPYGHGKLEYLTSIAIGLVVLLLGLILIYNSFSNKNESTSVIVIVVSLFTILFKFLLANYVVKKGKEYKNNILIASGKESSADVISSIVVLLSAVLMFFSKYNGLFKYADMIATIVVGLFIIRTGFNILKENISIILGEQETDKEYINNIRTIILASSLVKNIDSLVLMKFGQYYNLNCEISMEPELTLLESHNELEEIQKSLESYDSKIKYQTIHVNPYIRRKK